MRWPPDEHAPSSRTVRQAVRPVAPDEPRRASPETRAMQRDMKLLEQLRKLRRERAESAMRDARAEVSVAHRMVLDGREVLAGKLRLYKSAQENIGIALGTSVRSLEDVNKLLDLVDRSRKVARQAQGQVATLQRSQRDAEDRAEEAARATQAAAASHEKVLEWKKSA